MALQESYTTSSTFSVGRSALLASLCITIWGLLKLYRRCIVKCRVAGMRGPPLDSWTKGNLLTVYMAAAANPSSLQKEYGGAFKVNGLYGDEQLYISDPLALQQILVKEPHVFGETDAFIATGKPMFGPSVSVVTGATHHRQRKLLNPLFAPSRLRLLAPTMHDVVRTLCDLLSNRITKQGNNKVDVLNPLIRSALEVAGQCVAGHPFDALDEDGSKLHRWPKTMRDMIPMAMSLQTERNLSPFLVQLGPAWFRRWLISVYPKKALKTIRDMADDMWAMSRQALEENMHLISSREGAQAPCGGNDIISSLVRANAEAAEKDRMTDDEVLSQSTTTVIGATDTTANTVARLLQKLAQNPDLQTKVREEILAAKEAQGSAQRDLDWDRMNALPWLDAVCRESLRLHSPVTFLARTCRQGTIVTLSRPITLADGRTTAHIPVAKNQNIILGLATANQDPLVWGEDAAEWKPERWLVTAESNMDAGREGEGEGEGGKLKIRVPASADGPRYPGVYSGMMTFTGGPRACLGFKFAEMEIKITLCLLLEQFDFAEPKEGEEIDWGSGQIATPAVSGVDGPQLPLRVSRRF